MSKSPLKCEKLWMVMVVHLRFPNEAMSAPLHSEFMQNEADTKTYLNSETGSVSARLKLAQLEIFLLNFRSICLLIFRFFRHVWVHQCGSNIALFGLSTLSTFSSPLDLALMISTSNQLQINCVCRHVVWPEFLYKGKSLSEGSHLKLNAYTLWRYHVSFW